MMRLAAFCLLTSATTAHAEGDWVLWTPPAWSGDMSAIAIAVGSFHAREECEAEKQARQAKSERRSLMMCLPDTADSHGPKWE
jgi:hypothetical protein